MTYLVAGLTGLFALGLLSAALLLASGPAAQRLIWDDTARQFLTVLLAVPWVVSGFGAVTVVLAAVNWRRGIWQWHERVYFSLLLPAIVAILWSYHYWRLFSR